MNNFYHDFYSTFGIPYKLLANNTVEWICSIDQVPPSAETVAERLAELQAAEPLRQLRQQRDQKLAQSDWMAVADRTMSQAQIDYRQALRDLPSTADPRLDENGNLTNVNWPSL